MSRFWNRDYQTGIDHDRPINSEIDTSRHEVRVDRYLKKTASDRACSECDSSYVWPHMALSIQFSTVLNLKRINWRTYVKTDGILFALTQKGRLCCYHRQTANLFRVLFTFSFIKQVDFV